jgi:HprK-related kinase B
MKGHRVTLLDRAHRFMNPGPARLRNLSVAGLVRDQLAEVACPETSTFRFPEGSICVRSNSAELLAQLERYFAPWSSPTRPDALELIAIDGEPPTFGLSPDDYSSDADKRSNREAWVDLRDGRIFHELSTGMKFLVGRGPLLCRGHCSEHSSSVIEFILSRLQEVHQRDGWAPCHAAGLVSDGRGLAVAGPKRGGKSTFALLMLRHGAGFASNDDLWIKAGPDGARMAGIPKQPSVNPGTALHNPDLRSLLDASEAQRLAGLPTEELWKLKGHYGVDVAGIWGADRWRLRSPLTSFLVLGWSLESDAATRIESVELRSRPDLMKKIVKAPKYFQVRRSRRTIRRLTHPKAYLRNLARVPVFEATGRIDLDRLIEFGVEHLRLR